jgi:DNA-binding NarL/FixJ family response regulator
MIRVVLADDHRLVRDSLIRLLELEADLDVVGVGATGEEAVSLVERHQPEIALLDVRMPGVGGINAAREIISRWPEVKVVLLTMHDEDEIVFEALAAGARGYLLKDCEHEDLLRTLRDVANGEVSLSAPIMDRVLGEFRAMRRQRPGAGLPPGPAIADVLTSREQEVLEALVRGLSNKQIARHLAIDETTVKTHLHRLYEKLDVRDRTQAAVLALQRGWCTASEE